MKKNWNTPKIDNLSTKATQWGELTGRIPDGTYTDMAQNSRPVYEES